MSDTGSDAARSTPRDGGGYGSVAVDSGPLAEGAAPGEGTPDEQRIRDLRDLLEPRKVKLLQQILATEWGSLSPAELAVRNPEVTDSTIRDHLRTMAQRERPFVVKLEDEEQKHAGGDLPWTYYAVTEYGVELLEQTGFYDSITLLYQAYDAAETPEEIRHIEAYDGRPTPDWL
jgi:hypothetical protein